MGLRVTGSDGKEFLEPITRTKRVVVELESVGPEVPAISVQATESGGLEISWAYGSKPGSVNHAEITIRGPGE